MKVPDQLKEIAEQLANGKSPSPETVRTFIRWFGAYRRGSWIVSEIRRALKSLNIQTKPDFNSVYIDSKIQFVKCETPSGTKQEKSDTSDIGDASGLDKDADIPIPGATIDPTYRIGKLESANRKPLRIEPDCTIAKAITLMLKNDYSQLPVMTNDRDVKGIISWETLGSRLALGNSITLVRECMEPAHEVPVEESLFGAIPQIVKFGSVLVRAQDRMIVGIVTTSDLSDQFRQLSEPFLLLEEIENHIRSLIDGRFSAKELATARDESDAAREVQTVANLTFGEYIRLLENPGNWERIGLNLDRVVFTEELDKVRKIRNEVMHFDPGSFTREDQETLRRFVNFLQKLQTLVASS